MSQLRVHDAGVSCSLDEHDAAQRNAEFADVVQRGLRQRELLTERTVRLTFENKQELAHHVHELTRREAECCGFFSFDTDVSGDEIVLEVDAPPEGATYLQLLYDATDPSHIRPGSGSSSEGETNFSSGRGK